jgi:hypothetical protein
MAKEEILKKYMEGPLNPNPRKKKSVKEAFSINFKTILQENETIRLRGKKQNLKSGEVAHIYANNKFHVATLTTSAWHVTSTTSKISMGKETGYGYKWNRDGLRKLFGISNLTTGSGTLGKVDFRDYKSILKLYSARNGIERDLNDFADEKKIDMEFKF